MNPVPVLQCTCSGAAAESACQCLPYYSCPRSPDAPKDDDEDLIDIRQQTRDNSTCSHYLHACCDPSARAPDPPPEQPDQPPQGPPQGPRESSTFPPPQLCGVRNKNGVGTRIFGGLNDESNFGEIPWMVAVFKKRSGGNEYLCGGGLIAPGVVLTAAHCIINEYVNHVGLAAASLGRLRVAFLEACVGNGSAQRSLKRL